MESEPLTRSCHEWRELNVANSLSQTAGVGALLQLTDHAADRSYLPAYDGHGNIVALLSANDGIAVAK